MDERLEAQLAFLRGVDRLKAVLRANPLIDGTRRENSAEHSWHVALIVLVLAERLEEPVDLARTLTIALVHDIVEVDAGDTPPWDVAGRATKAERETAAADRIFGLLPDDQASDLRSAWDEFEAATTPEARLARAADRLAALLVNHASGGLVWREHGRTEADARDRNAVLAGWAPGLHEVATGLIDDAVDRGWFGAGPGTVPGHG